MYCNKELNNINHEYKLLLSQSKINNTNDKNNNNYQHTILNNLEQINILIIQHNNNINSNNNLDNIILNKHICFKLSCIQYFIQNLNIDILSVNSIHNYLCNLSHIIIDKNIIDVWANIVAFTYHHSNNTLLSSMFQKALTDNNLLLRQQVIHISIALLNWNIYHFDNSYTPYIATLVQSIFPALSMTNDLDVYLIFFLILYLLDSILFIDNRS